LDLFLSAAKKNPKKKSMFLSFSELQSLTNISAIKSELKKVNEEETYLDQELDLLLLQGSDFEKRELDKIDLLK
jgi:hypothetical protein